MANNTEGQSLPRASDNEADALQFLQSNFAITVFKRNLRTILFFLALYLSICFTYFYFVWRTIKAKKTKQVIDSLYFSVLTMTTIGYGDLVSVSKPTKVVASILCFPGLAFVGFLLERTANYLVEKQETLILEVLRLRDTSAPHDLRRKPESREVKYNFYLSVAIFLVLVIAGILFLVHVERLEFVDAFYCVSATVTTMGYRDSFSTPGGRVFASFWIIACTLSLGQLLVSLTHLLTERQQRESIERVLRKKMTIKDLEAADIDNSGDVGKAEFALFKLKEMGKFTQKEETLLLNEFESLDVDHSGTLTPLDLRNRHKR